MDRDLIDRNELIEKLDPEYKETVKLIKSGETHLDNLAEGYTEVHDLITRAPTIDAEPVRHGHWEQIINPYGEIEGWICGCGAEVKIHSNYCPYCGTKMDEEK